MSRPHEASWQCRRHAKFVSLPAGRKRDAHARAAGDAAMSQRNRLRSLFGAGTVAVLALADLGHAQTVAPTNSLPNPYRAIENWGKLPEIGRASGREREQE